MNFALQTGGRGFESFLATDTALLKLGISLYRVYILIQFANRLVLWAPKRVSLMILRKMSRVFTMTSLITLLAGAQESIAAASAPAGSSMDTIARIHWLGRKKISTDTNAVGVMNIWKMPESAKAGGASQLDKFATRSVGGCLRGETNPSSTNLLQPAASGYC